MFGRRHREQPAADLTGGPKIRTGWLLAAVLVMSALFLPAAVLAQAGSDMAAAGLETAEAIGLSTTDLPTMIGRIINAFLGLLGIIVLVLFIYGGYLYMTARGDSAQVETAKKIMVNAVIGLVIIVSAYAIASFILKALLGDGGGAGGDGGGGGGQVPLIRYCDGCGPEQLGNGLISYHYPESNQMDVPRDTAIAITFKLPLLPSTVLSNYHDAGTADFSDDQYCPSGDCADGQMVPLAPGQVFYLNTDNIKILPFSDLGPVAGGTATEQFDSRYDSETVLTGTGVRASLSQITEDSYTNGLGQTLTVMLDEPLGSSQADVNYRVALRGGTDGLKILAWDAEANEPKVQPAFGRLNPDGSYFWNFTTGTEMDLLPPEIRAVIPKSQKDLPTGEEGQLFRNQLLQIYFTKTMNPSTVSGVNGQGFVNVETYYYDTAAGEWKVLPGTWNVAAGYRVIEYVPETECDGIAENSCGDRVYCLPANTKVAVVVRPAGVSANPPKAEAPNGVIDMSNNVLDGNADGELAGYGSVVWSGLSGNPTLIPGTSVWSNFFRDTAVWLYEVGDDLDLEPPKVTAVDPKNLSALSGQAYPAGSSKFPPNGPITSGWSKPMSVSSMVTGPDSYGPATIGLRAREISKDGSPIGNPGFSVQPTLIDNDTRTEMVMSHRTFLTANDLGWSLSDNNPDAVPVYVPVFRARLKDVRQNCFFPSEAVNCEGADRDQPYCCNDTVGAEASDVCNPSQQ